MRMERTGHDGGTAGRETWHVRRHADDPLAGAMVKKDEAERPAPTEAEFFWRAGFDRNDKDDKLRKVRHANAAPALTTAMFAVLRGLLRRGDAVALDGRLVEHVRARVAFVRPRDFGVSDPALVRRGGTAEALLWTRNDETGAWADAHVPHAWLELRLKGSDARVCVDVAFAALDNADEDDDGTKPMARIDGVPFFDGAEGRDVHTAARLRREFEAMNVAQRLANGLQREREFDFSRLDELMQAVAERIGAPPMSWDEEVAAAASEPEPEPEPEPERIPVRIELPPTPPPLAPKRIEKAPAPAQAQAPTAPQPAAPPSPAPQPATPPSPAPQPAAAPLSREERIAAALARKRRG